MTSGLKQCIEADSPQLIRYLPQNKMLITQFISIPGHFPSPNQNPGNIEQFFDDPSPAQYAIIINRPNALQALINLSCNSPNEGGPDNSGFGLPIEDVFLPKPFSTNCKLPLLNLAVRVNNFRCLKILVDYLKSKNYTIDTTDRDLHTPLLEAVLNSNSEMTLYLLREGADPLFTPKNNALARPIMNALFVMPELFIWMVKTLNELKKSDKFLPLLSEKFDPKTFQLSSSGKTLQEILATRQDLSFSRNAFAQVLNNTKNPEVITPNDGLQNTVAPQQPIVEVELCQECKANPSCIICPLCGKHLCAEHESKHDCK
ncbi:hypothetical protein TRFO_26223 [Tritrichomonas foetus]|uniref:Uncharacterized protein n=1 Tax=Tritrichomonas foetus TaxID=1144522 RepID=A0A1J4K358_9EUKA|nr:hypothetical protein TRFO_26223 [Tritrichomonas foetus]|eukprot:OHT05873.1 hypothetical protein TRFO_26223 [Tritrichomonas foetus]